ncbi:MAG: tryptophan--tRNA ligase [Vallitalea sp.]|jgi:tryptophanyl-tRNA synthetase|nr:tryptophan--tRNA ligase [Vallitalea sp.]
MKNRKGVSMSAEQKKIIFSGIQPTGVITIGNYIGAIKNWTKLQDDYNCLFCAVDMHSITVRQDPALLRKRARDLLTMYIAAGLDPEKNIMYYQSHVSGHAELAWILNCFTYMGELNRMTQFKEKSAKHGSNINAGLFTYPVLMAADILLYQTDLVPVGHDQKQHLELAREIATRFNNVYGDVFTVPEPYIAKVGAKIMSLQEPTKKMSKSDENPNGYISLMDEPNVIIKKIKRAVTDSDREVTYSESKPGVKNLIDIYSCVTSESIESSIDRFVGKGYGELKQVVGEAIVEELKPVQERFKDLQKNKDYIDSIIKKNGETANYLATKTLRKAQKKVGFPVRIR